MVVQFDRQRCKAAVALAVVAAFLLSSGCKGNTDGIEEARSSKSPRPEVPAGQAKGANGSSSADGFVPPESFCGNDAACLESPIIAKSPQELAWMRAHGYPTPTQLRNFSVATDQALQDAAREGSLPAMVIYGARLVHQGDSKQGLDLIARAADNGSIFAYYELAKIHAKHPALADKLEAGAFLRLAYLLGDHKAALVLQRELEGFGPVEMRLIDERAATLYRTFAKSRRPDPRPQ